MSSFSREQLENWLQTIDVKCDFCLDVGGSQNPIKGRTKSWEVGIYKILDLEFPHEVSVKPDIMTDLNIPIKNEDLAYIAGLADGEGSISITRKTNNDRVYFPQFSITMVDYNGLKVIENVFGFEFKLIKKTDGKDYWNLQLTGDKLKLFLSVIYPYLKIKHKQALLALELRNDIDLKKKSFIFKPEGFRFNGSESQDKETIDKRKRIYETNLILNKYGSRFDILFALEVMEYVFDPVTALETMAYFLKPNGILYLSTHFIHPVHNPVEQDYLRYTRAGIEKLLEKTGFRIEEIIPRNEIDGSRITFLDYILGQRMRPAKDYEGHNETGYLIRCCKL